MFFLLCQSSHCCSYKCLNYSCCQIHSFLHMFVMINKNVHITYLVHKVTGAFHCLYYTKLICLIDEEYLLLPMFSNAKICFKASHLI